MFDVEHVFLCFIGFVCPIENSIQYFCCGTDNYRYCCSPDRYSFETRSSLDYPETYHPILTHDIDTLLINNRKMINKQFEQFQKYFLPAFILTTTILFLVGIALWFWLYKHKAFYSLGQDDFIEARTRNNSDCMAMKRDSINPRPECQSRTLTNPSTEV
jgi:hypothetical protein